MVVTHDNGIGVTRARDKVATHEHDVAVTSDHGMAMTCEYDKAVTHKHDMTVTHDQDMTVTGFGVSDPAVAVMELASDSCQVTEPCDSFQVTEVCGSDGSETGVVDMAVNGEEIEVLYMCGVCSVTFRTLPQAELHAASHQ
jgi:hypothetical protein